MHAWKERLEGYKPKLILIILTGEEQWRNRMAIFLCGFFFFLLASLSIMSKY